MISDIEQGDEAVFLLLKKLFSRKDIRKNERFNLP